MQELVPRLGRIFLLEAALGLLVLQSPISCAEETRVEIVEADSPMVGILSAPPSKGGRALENLPEHPIEYNKPSLPESPSKDSYTINFNNISIIEYIRFVSKISNLNFVFDEGDLQFNVTIVSEDPVTPRNIMSILIQILRIHDLIVLEQEGNLIITKAGANANQIATIISSDLPEENMGQIPLVTRVFRVKNANLSTVVSVIKPMMSTSALIETSVETRQLIVTDITTNVDKISALLASIDIPHTSLEIDSYTSQNVNPSELVALATMIVSPFAEGNPLIFVPQPATNSIFIISTPYLIERSLAVLEDLDVPSKPGAEGAMAGPHTNIYFYKILNRPSEDLMNSVAQVSGEIKKGGGSAKLISALDSAKFIKDSNSILFMGDDETLEKVKEIMPTLDTPLGPRPSKSNFFVYKIQHVSDDQLQSALNEVADNLKKAPTPDQPLIDALYKSKFIKDSNSILFTGDIDSLAKIKEIIPSFDTAHGAKPEKSNFFFYKIQNATEQQIENALNELADNLKNAPIPDKPLIDVINNAKFIKDSNSFLFTGDTDSLAKIKEIMPSLDTTPSAKPQKSNFFFYKIQNATDQQIENALNGLADNLKNAPIPDKALIDVINNAKFIKDSNSFLFTGDTDSLAKIKEIMPTLDTPLGPRPLKSNFFVYKIQHTPDDKLENSLNELADNLKHAPSPDQSLLDAINNAKFIKDSNSILFMGDNETLAKIKEIMPTLDTPLGARPQKSNFLVYKIQHTSDAVLEQSLNEMAENLSHATTPDQSLLDTIHSMKYIKETNSLIFTGDDASLKKISDLLPTFDITSAISSQFFIYNPQYRNGDEIQKSLKEISNNLKDSGLADPIFMQAIDSMKWVSSTNSLIFTGNAAALERINGMIKTIDTPRQVHAKGEVFLYKPHYASQDQLQHALDQLSKNLDSTSPSDERLQETISSMRWIDDSQSFLFRGDATTLGRLKELLANLDTPEGLTGGNANTFFLYKLQSAQGEDVISNLQKIAQNLKESGVPNPGLIASLQNVRWIKDNNSLLLTGSTATIDQVRKLVEQFDTARPSGPISPSAGKSAFYIYKPLHRSPEEIESSLQDVAKDLEASGLIDPDLLLTLGTMRNVESTHSLLFTGTPTSLEKVKELLVRIDTVNPNAQIQQLGQLTFLIYKIQYVPPAQLIASLKGLSTDLANSGAIDKDVVEAINTMKWIKETNSILFVGSAPTLQQVDAMIRKFDLPSLAKSEAPTVMPTPGTFVVYTPKNQPGDELIAIIDEFEQNLISSGLADKNLYDAINNLKWIPKTCSILISGTPDSITKVEDLLRRFDIPSKSEIATPPSIESIENTSFLIYKLNYHQGDEIVAALKQVITEISSSNSANNQNLLSALNSLQWIQVTNSLLATGDGPTLAKVKDLISNLDIPLRQVFIEILIVETSLTNTQNFGLQWGGKMQWMNRFAAGSGNFPVSGANASNASTNSGAPTTGLLNNNGVNLNTVTAAATPTTAMIPFLTGFDLGVIGDIIMHKGRSFLSLGSLVNALQTDTDSHIVMNPKIITQDNRNSTIFVGNNLPYIGSVINQAGGINTSNNVSLEYRDIGINLSITPMVGSTDITTLDIDTDISEVIGSPSQGTSGSSSSSTTTTVTGIQTSHTTMSTRVHVPNKHFVCLSGMLQDSKTHYRSQIPCLGGLPVIGAAFTESDRLNSKQNVLIFVRPIIIDTADEYKALTDHQEDLYKETIILPILKEEFDAGIDWVKTPENE